MLLQDIEELGIDLENTLEPAQLQQLARHRRPGALEIVEHGQQLLHQPALREALLVVDATLKICKVGSTPLPGAIVLIDPGARFLELLLEIRCGRRRRRCAGCLGLGLPRRGGVGVFCQRSLFS